MSVLIKGMKMPKDCVIKVAIRGDDGIASVYLDDGKADYYSVIELPDHGDLVDIDRMLDDFAEIRDYDFASREYVVIPAERSEE